MSLFDVIKYSSIDLGDYCELNSLPKELLNLYWNNFSSTHLILYTESYAHIERCTLLSAYYNLPRIHMWQTKMPVSPDMLKQIFNKSLMEYGNEPV